MLQKASVRVTDKVCHRLLVHAAVYYKGGSNNRVDNEAYYKMLCDLIGDYPIQYIIIDPSASSMIETIRLQRLRQKYRSCKPPSKNYRIPTAAARLRRKQLHRR